MHSSVEDLKLAEMQIKILPALQDNYMYLIICSSTREAAIVDPVVSETVINAVQEENCKLNKVLHTNQHLHHPGGDQKLVKQFTNHIEVFGCDEYSKAINRKVRDNDRFKIGDLNVTCFFTPCHTTTHICYYVEAPNGDKCLFTGDILFQGDCGRFCFYEGKDEAYTLVEKLLALPDDTKVFCGHENTLQTMLFARHVEPQNDSILKRIEWAKFRRATQLPTVPSTIADEKSWNPFLRLHKDTIQKHTHETDPILCIDSLLKERDNLKDPSKLLLAAVSKDPDIPQLSSYDLAVINATQFWSELFDIMQIGMAFFVTFLLQTYRFLLYFLIKILLVGLLEISSDYMIKPLLTALFEGFLQPSFVFCLNIVSSICNIFMPVADIVNNFMKPVATVGNSLRLVDFTYNKKNVNKNLQKAEDTVEISNI